MLIHTAEIKAQRDLKYVTLFFFLFVSFKESL